MSSEDPVLPDQTADDTDADWGEPADEDERLLDEVPPHHVDRD